MADRLFIRKGELADIDAIKVCIDQAYAPYVPRIGQRPSSMDSDFVPLLREGRVWVLDLDGVVVGLMVIMDEEHTCEIRSVAVLPAYQRKGLGRRLMAHAETLARSAGCSTLRLYTNANIPELVTYYSRLGYSEEARRQDRGYDRVFMVKILTPDMG